MRKLILILLLTPGLAAASQIMNPSSSGGGGSGIVSPGTFTWTNSFGMAVSTINMTGAATITGLADGTTNSMAVNFQQLSNVANANAVMNGNFNFWTNGTSFASIGSGSGTVPLASHWTAQAPNVVITVVREATTIATGSLYSMKVTFGSVIVGNGTFLENAIPNYWEYAGSSVTLSMAENSSKTQTWHLSIQDSSGNTAGSNCANSSAWTTCSVTRFVPAGVTSLSIRVNFDASTVDFGTLYLDQAMILKGQEAIPYVPGQIGAVGVTDGSSATAGNVGEYVTSYSATNNFPATNTWGDATSISLGAGDWDVSVNARPDTSNSVTTTYIAFGVSTTSGNSGTGLVDGDNLSETNSIVATTNVYFDMVVPAVRVSLSSAASVYLKFQATYAAGQPTVQGCRISARRVR